MHTFRLVEFWRASQRSINQLKMEYFVAVFFFSLMLKLFYTHPHILELLLSPTREQLDRVRRIRIFALWKKNTNHTKPAKWNIDRTRQRFYSRCNLFVLHLGKNLEI